MPIFHRIVSLGSNCEVTWNIRNHFGIETAYPFDWWITLHSSVRHLLTGNFAELLTLDNLEILNGGETVRCKKYEILHHHDFKRDENDMVLPDLASQLPNLREKYSALTTRLYRDCANGRILFVRNRAMTEGGAPELQEHMKLSNLLAAIFPNADITLLVTNSGFRGSSGDNRIIWDEITAYDDVPAGHWTGSPKGWAEMFARHDIQIAPG